MCFGVFVSPDNVADAIAYMGVASRVNVDMPESKDIDDEIIQVWAEYMVQNKDWLIGLGAQDFVVYADQGRDPKWPGNSAIKAYQLKMPDGRPGVGVDLFNFLAQQVASRNIEVLWETPATRLITNEKREVIGVVARSRDGGEISIKASRAVVLTCGGYEFDEAALKTYLPAYPMVFYGNPDNTGDGVRMAMEIGADLWHMTVLGGGFKAKFPDFPTAILMNFGAQAFIVVDKFGRRFKAENQLGGYSGYWNALVYDTVNYTWPRIPVYWIFDESRRMAGPLAFTAFGAAGPIGMYEWSQDNSKEIEKGWIIKGETIEELAEKINIDPAVLAEEVSKYNGYAQAKEDPEFGRPAETLLPLDKPPFYAVPLWPGLNNTFGGPRRNAKAQIVDVRGKPIPRLYSAGELGSIYVQYPQGGANVGECFAFGRIAGENAAAEEPWG
jgi:succinate dehydrogenase/fumarate reductase flavoprotein subunit